MVIHRKIGIVAGVCAAIAGATIGTAARAQANPFSAQFESPSGDIACNLVNYPPTDTHSVAKNFVQCDVANHSWVHPQPPPHGRTDATTTFLLMRGQAPIVGYSPGTLAAPDATDYSQAWSGGSITCSTEQSAVKCTDVSTGHFFRVSLESYELG
ncbi:hypothetical protein [Mycobacterium sp.]|uniref:hypothetical protein n=1 Tax=Mycobacterium sp. TaxID=1785 RepID=UPI003C743067